jgi:hypothetical protein
VTLATEGVRVAAPGHPRRRSGETVGPVLVSVVIINYNYARFLRQAVDSALHQTYPTVEVVAVDDGSTDNSREILASYGDRIVPVLKANGGQASAFNAGFAMARGDLVMFMDSDDVLMPDVAERAAELFRLHPDVGAVRCRLALVDAAGTRTGAFLPPRHIRVGRGGGRPYDLRRSGQVSMWPSTSGTAYSARVLTEILPMPEVPTFWTGYSDGYVCRAASLLASFVLIDQVGASYRIHASNKHYVSRSTLDLEDRRVDMVQWAEMYQYLEKFAASRARCGAVGSAHEDQDAPSRMRRQDVGLMTLRIVSRKLDPAGHPGTDDGAPALAWRGAVAVSGCLDLSAALKWLHFAWFGAMAVAPRPLARWLAERKLCPETRRGWGRFAALLSGGCLK